MEWNVFYHNVNRQKIETFNIFEHGGFAMYVETHLKKCKTKKEFELKLKEELLYFFYSKAEWEVLILPWCGGMHTREEKVDVYTQVMNNWNVFVDYVWGNKEKNV